MTLTRTPPPLSTTSAAVLLSATLAILFVASLYVLGSVRGADGKALRRNDARVVRQRMVAVAVACLGSVAVVQWALALSMRDTLAVLGVLPPVDETYASWMVRSLTMIACALLWTACLFLGPLVTARFDGRLVDLLTGRDTLSVSPWIWWRNMVVAPAGEEFVFRCCNVVLWQHAGISTNAIVFLSPLLFAAAHLHHVVEHRRAGGSMHAIAAVITFQFAYTTVFGWFAAHLFLRYHSFWVVVAVHSLCNAMGFPEFSDMAEHPRAKVVTASYIVGLLLFIVGFYTAPFIDY